MHEWLVARLAELGDYMRTDVENFLRNTELQDSTAVRDLLATGNNVKSWNTMNLTLWWKTYIP